MGQRGSEELTREGSCSSNEGSEGTPFSHSLDWAVIGLDSSELLSHFVCTFTGKEEVCFLVVLGGIVGGGGISIVGGEIPVTSTTATEEEEEGQS